MSEVAEDIGEFLGSQVRVFPETGAKLWLMGDDGVVKLDVIDHMAEPLVDTVDKVRCVCDGGEEF